MKPTASNSVQAGDPRQRITASTSGNGPSRPSPPLGRDRSSQPAGPSAGGLAALGGVVAEVQVLIAAGLLVFH
jgi:hypothetical protein